MTKTKFDVKALRDKVLASDDIKYSEVYVEEWDTTLPIKTLSSAEMKKVMKHQNDNVRMMILAILHGCKTSDGEAVFVETDLLAFEENKAFGPIVAVGSKILEISGLSGKEVEDAKNN